MPTYAVLCKWTSQGIQSVKQSPGRLDAGRKAFEAAGIKMKDFYLVMGQYDMIIVVDAPDDATLAKAALTLASAGNIQTETLRAFTEDEYRKIVSGIA
ncbi:GYD domain-containing protein [Alloacidobacterium dinghuense]|uniref:GYD domain-containing protein n=1 Tax=Alloacidobacterium dinghuense TaxID=2763107 RepID=A0A7G8BCC8_9BACT|nr:GYD domain-containing protein [Alloacidobacterium dinghuense]QNI30198.1 GYD domain-containing protein [Alloacidobacterium dinghuense]